MNTKPMTESEARKVLDRVARVVASVHGVLNAAEAEQAERAKSVLGISDSSEYQV